VAADPLPMLPSAPQLAWLVTQAPSALSEADAAAVARIEQDPEAARAIWHA
jgi:hypothetical protein